MKNLVMGLAKGYNWYILEPFVRSFIKNVPNADLVLFTDRFSPFTRDRFKKIGGGRIKLEPVPDYAQNARPNNIRWKIFAEYVKKHGAKYKQILTSDTRDVIFQSDVFKEFENQSNYLGYTTEGDNIKGEKCGNNSNYQWITESFGKAEADKLADKEIICDGTVIGTTKEMEIFFGKMVEYMPSFDKGHDQTVMQYLCYNNLLPINNIIKISYYDGAIFTTSLFAAHNQMKVKDNFILSPNGRIPAVVHQYDRPGKELNDFVERIYRQKDFKFDKRFVDFESIYDQIPHLVFSENWRDLLKFFTNYFIDNADIFINKIDYSVSISGDAYRKWSEYLLTVWQKLLTKTPLTLEVEILEITLQRVMLAAFSQKINSKQLLQLYSLIMYATKINRVISPALKTFVYKCLINLANTFISNNDFKNAEGCLNYITEMKVPLNQEFYTLKEKIYRK